MRGRSKLHELRTAKPSEWAVSETVPGFTARVRVRLSIHQEVSRQPHAAFNNMPPLTRGANARSYYPGSDALLAILAATVITLLMLLAIALDFAPRVSSLGSQADSPSHAGAMVLRGSPTSGQWGEQRERAGRTLGPCTFGRDPVLSRAVDRFQRRI
jgi:hypothetical protein